MRPTAGGQRAPRRPVLLTTADFYGTLAAVRCLGRRGIPVTVAESRLLAPARWSRYVTRRVSCPPIDAPASFMEWLLDFGRREPGHVLIPTSDDLAWLFAQHRAELAQHFFLNSPPIEAVAGVLDKKSLYQSCRAAGLEVPETWFPADEAEVAALANRLPFPLLIKPRTQVFLDSHNKGDRVDQRQDLVARYRAFRAHNPYRADGLPGIGGGAPMLQRYHSEAADGIYSLAGFMGGGSRAPAMLASRKVLQRPRKLGIGLCFEAAEIDGALSTGVRALCRALGFYGIFEVEFIRTAGRSLLIDFNPRFYNQMALEVARGLPLPLLAYEAAIGNRSGFRTELARARVAQAPKTYIYCHHRLLELLMGSQRLSGRMTSAEVGGWRRWYAGHRGSRVDAVADCRDRLPGLVDLALHGWHSARHPRSFLRTLVLDQ